MSWALLMDVTPKRNFAVKEFYAKLWFDEAVVQSLKMQQAKDLSQWKGVHQFSVTAAAVHAFSLAVGRDLKVDGDASADPKVPMDFAIVAGGSDSSIHSILCVFKCERGDDCRFA